MVLFVNGSEWYGEYAAYHINKVNVWIHILCVPLIVFSLLLGGMAFPLDNSLLTPYLPAVKGLLLPHIAVSFIILYLGIFSLLLEPFVGLIFNAEVVGMYFAARHIIATYTHQEAIYIALAVHAISWIIQFIGHGSFEKRAPALLTNILQTTVAPSFVILELLFLLVNYRPAFHKSIEYAKRKHLPKNTKAK